MTPNIIPETPKNQSKLVPERINKQSRNTSGKKIRKWTTKCQQMLPIGARTGGGVNEKRDTFLHWGPKAGPRRLLEVTRPPKWCQTPPRWPQKCHSGYLFTAVWANFGELFPHLRPCNRRPIHSNEIVTSRAVAGLGAALWDIYIYIYPMETLWRP